jgi:ketosteroid isomerase-like protein
MRGVARLTQGGGVQPGDLVRDYYAAVDAGDTDRVLAFFHPAIEYRRGGYQPMCGVAEVRRFYEQDRIIATGQHTVAGLLSAGSLVAAHGSFAGTSRDGRELAVEWADFFEFADGLVLRRHTYFMTPGV